MTLRPRKAITVMIAAPLDAPCTLFEYLARQAELLKEEQARASQTKHRSRRGPSDQAQADRPASVLVQEDHLFFRLLSQVVDSLGQRGTAVAATFRRAFTSVWDQISAVDRRGLLRYWRSQPTGPSGLYPTLDTRPLIRVIEFPSWAEPSPVCGQCGHELTFTLSQALDNPDDLPQVIGTALAEAHLYATRRHWQLIESLIEEPLGRWEERHGKKADEAARESHLDRLEAAHSRAHQEEIGRILEAWGLGGAVTPQRRRRGPKKA